jgi:3-dehydroquinate synthetase
MILANYVAHQRGLLSQENQVFYEQYLLNPCLKVQPGREQMAAPEIIRAMEKDKKRTGSGLVLVMMTDRDGELLRVNDLDHSEVDQAIKYFFERKVEN